MQFLSRLNSSIIAKQAIVSFIILFFICGIVMVNFFTFHHAKKSMEEIVVNGFTSITKNAKLKKEFSIIFTKTQLLLATFTYSGKKFKSNSDQILERLRLNISNFRRVEQYQVNYFQEYAEQMKSLFDQCVLINQSLNKVQSLETKVDRFLTDLDAVVVEKKIKSVMGGRPKITEESEALLQLEQLLPGYREIFIEIKTQINTTEQQYLIMETGKAINEQRLLQLFNELYNGLHATTIGWKEIKLLTDQLSKTVSFYQQHIITLFTDMKKFQTVKKKLEKSQENILTVMDNLDAQIAENTHHLHNDITNKIQLSLNTTLLLSSIIIIIIVIIGLYTMKIIFPLKLLSQGAKIIGSGDLDHKIDLESKNELGQLASAINKMTEKLKETMVSRNYVNSIIESMADSLIVIDSNYTIKTTNQTTLELLGYNKKELIGKPFSILLEDNAAIPSALKIKDYVGKTEIAYMSKDGRIIPVLFTSSVMRDKKGKSQDIVCMAKDITERKQLEERLKIERDRAQMYLDIAGVMFVGLDHEGKVFLANKMAFKILGYELDEILGKIWFDHFLPDDQKVNVKKIFNQLMMGQIEQVEYYENTVLTKKQNERIIAWHNAPIKNEKLEIIGTLSSGEDITERKKAEKQRAEIEAELRHSQKLEALGNLSGGIAHEFNNMLGVILGNIDFSLSQKIQNKDLLECLKEIKKAGLRSRDIVKQILTYSQKTEVELEPVDLRTLVKDILRLVRASIPSSIDLNTSISDDVDIIMANPTQVSQVLLNLCTNSVNSISTGKGNIKVSIENVLVTEPNTILGLDLKPGPYLCLCVSDDGKGIPLKIIDRIFEPYFTTSQKAGGTGMGLSVVYGIMKSHSGAIKVDSTVNQGTTFTMYFPIKEEKKSLPSKSIKKEQIATGTERILFIDDEAPLCHLWDIVLKELGYKVTIQKNPIDAIALIKNAPDDFDLIITDMTMPQMTGDQLAKEVLSIRPDFPIILCTGYSEQIDGVKAKKIGIKKFLMKPLLIEPLSNAIREALG